MNALVTNNAETFVLDRKENQNAVPMLGLGHPDFLEYFLGVRQDFLISSPRQMNPYLTGSFLFGLPNSLDNFLFLSR